LMTILEEKKMPLRKIIKWNDPWEVPARYLLGIDNLAAKEKEYKVYGCCWSKNPDSDALWQVYSQDCKGVCISSTVGMLKNAIIKKHPKISAFLAEIIYDSVENNLLNDLFRRQYSDKYPDPFLYACFKRKAFQHEQEIRFLVNAGEISCPTPDFFFIENIDYRHLINEVIFDPRVEDWYFQTMKTYLSKHKIPSRKSLLYTTGKLDVKIDAKSSG